MFKFVKTDCPTVFISRYFICSNKTPFICQFERPPVVSEDHPQFSSVFGCRMFASSLVSCCFDFGGLTKMFKYRLQILNKHVRHGSAIGD